MENTGRKTVKGRTTSAPLVAKSTKPTSAARPPEPKETAATPPAPAMAAPVTSTDGGVKRVPTHEEIALRSFELFLARGGENGHHLEDWVQAERELNG